MASVDDWSIGGEKPRLAGMQIESISAVTLAVADMARAVDFYTKCGFERRSGGPQDEFSTFAVGSGFLNLILTDKYKPHWWGRTIFYVDSVDEHYQRLLAAGLMPDAAPQDAPWRERFFHITDPDGHELSFAKPLAP